jgi:hypothetical protein
MAKIHFMNSAKAFHLSQNINIVSALFGTITCIMVKVNNLNKIAIQSDIAQSIINGSE